MARELRAYLATHPPEDWPRFAFAPPEYFMAACLVDTRHVVACNAPAQELLDRFRAAAFEIGGANNEPTVAMLRDVCEAVGLPCATVPLSHFGTIVPFSGGSRAKN